MSKQGDGGFEVLEVFPEIRALGEARLQQICNEWLETPIAKEFAVSSVNVRTKHSKLRLTFRCDVTHKVQDREEYWFPMDKLLFYIADRGVQSEVDRKRVKARIVSARQRGGPEVYQRFVVNLGPELPLFLTCKNPECRNLMMTQFRGRKCERAIWGPSPVKCPRCQGEYEYDQDDLHFGPNQ